MMFVDEVMTVSAVSCSFTCKFQNERSQDLCQKLQDNKIQTLDKFRDGLNKVKPHI